MDAASLLTGLLLGALLATAATLGAVLITRVAACWRADQPYRLQDLDGRLITEAEGRAICATLRPVTGTGRRSKESQRAPSTGPSTHQARNKRNSV